MKALSIEELENLIYAAMEPAEPWQTIADVMDEHAGKPLPTRHAAMIADRLPVSFGEAHVFVGHVGNMTHIQVWPNGKYEEQQSLLIDWRTVNVQCPTRAVLEERNTQAFEARKRRNLERLDLLKDTDSLARLADTLARLVTAQRDFKELMAYGSPCSVIEYEVTKA